MSTTLTGQELVMTAHTSLRDFCDIIEQENSALQQHRPEVITQLVKQKQLLAGRVEKLLQQVQKSQTEGADLPRAGLQLLQTTMDKYRTLSRQNMLLLQAAHQATADFILLVKQTLDAEKPSAKTYGKTGQVNTGGYSETKLVNRAI